MVKPSSSFWAIYFVPLGIGRLAYWLLVTKKLEDDFDVIGEVLRGWGIPLGVKVRVKGKKKGLGKKGIYTIND